MGHTVATVPPQHAAVQPAAAAENYRVLKPDGRCTVISWWARNLSASDLFLLFFSCTEAQMLAGAAPLTPAVPVLSKQTLILDAWIRGDSGMIMALSTNEAIYSAPPAPAGKFYGCTL